jgi:hypothetical protein
VRGGATQSLRPDVQKNLGLMLRLEVYGKPENVDVKTYCSVFKKYKISMLFRLQL